VDRFGNIQIAHKHMNVGIGTGGRAIPFLGIHKLDFRYSVKYFQALDAIPNKLIPQGITKNISGGDYQGT
jgi:hypothetical protein